MIESLPSRPLTMDEGETLSEESGGRLTPDPYLQLPEREIEGFVGLMHLSPSGATAVGFDPDSSEWSVLFTQSLETSPYETYEHLDEWVEETYGVGV